MECQQNKGIFSNFATEQKILRRIKVKELYERYPILKECDSDIESVVEMLCESYKKDIEYSDYNMVKQL